GCSSWRSTSSARRRSRPCGTGARPCWPDMPILSVGVSYRRAPVELLERLAFPTEEFGKAYHHLTLLDGVHGGVILSTCNRVEVVAEVDSYHEGTQVLRGFLAESREVSVDELG